MTDTTTIEITTEQKEELNSLKRSDSESHKDTLQHLIGSYRSEPDLTESRVRDIARQEINDLVTHRALE